MTIEPDPNGISWAACDDIEPVVVDVPPTQRTGVGPIVERVRTRMTEREIAVALDLGHVGAFNVTASQLRLSVANAHVWQETARGTSLWNYCLVNLDWLPGDPGDRFPLVADEGYGASAHSMRKYLRSFPDAFSGAVAYWRTMAGRYGSALPFFDAGDGDGAGRKLKELRFYTGDVEIYARALRLMSVEFMSKRKGGVL
jgi:hypothetical protein